MKIFQITFLLFLFSQAHGQDIFNGTIIDNNSGVGLPYVNIGVVGKNIGTVSGMNGNFEIIIDNIHDQDTLRISMIGYESREFVVADFKKQIRKEAAVNLVPSVTQLKEIIVSSRNLKEKVLGNKTTSKNVTGAFSSDDLGNEVGVVIKIKRSPTYIKDFNCFIAKNDYGKLKFRLNFYELKNGMPGKNILKKNIIVETEIKQGKLKVDLTPYDIVVEKDFLVSLEWIEDLGQGGLFFSARFFGNPMIERKTSQGAWNKIKIASLGFNVTARY